MEYILSVFPIVLLFVLLLGCKMSGWKSALITLAATIVIIFLGNIPGLIHPVVSDGSLGGIIGWAVVEGVFKAIFPILLIILTAIFSYNIMIESGQIEVIKRQFVSLTDDKGILVLLMVWGFGGLLEGMAGFGTAVAIPAAILIGLGFKPFFSALVALLGNTVATAFGAVGVPVITLCKEAAPDGVVTFEMTSQVARDTIFQMSPMFFLIPFFILMLTDKKAWVKNILLTLWVGGVSLIVQYVCALYIGIETPAIIGSIAAILAIIVAAKVMKSSSVQKGVSLKEAAKAWSVYLSILVLILLSSTLCQPIYNFLKTHLVSVVNIPVINSRFQFGWLSNAALMIFIGSIIGGMIQGLSLKKLMLVLAKTTIGLRFTTLTIIGLIALASVMNYTGLIGTLASGIVKLTGSFYPLFAPLIGAIGTFVTGSDTSSNILFAKLQMNVAGKLGFTGSDANWLLASNSTGATGGKMLSPQSIAIATAACDMKGSDAAILKSAIPYALVYVLLSGLIVYFGV